MFRYIAGKGDNFENVFNTIDYLLNLKDYFIDLYEYSPQRNLFCIEICFDFVEYFVFCLL